MNSWLLESDTLDIIVIKTILDHVLLSTFKSMKSLVNFNFFYHIVSLNDRRTFFPSLVMLLILCKKQCVENQSVLSILYIHIVVGFRA